MPRKQNYYVKKKQFPSSSCPLQLSIPAFFPRQALDGAHYLYSMLEPHVQNSLTSLSRPLPLPDIGWDPIICTCSSSMSFHPFHPFIPADYLTLPASPLSPALLTLPSTSPVPSPGYYVWPLSTLILRIYSIYLFPLPLPTPPWRLSHPPPTEPAISCMATSTPGHVLAGIQPDRARRRRAAASVHPRDNSRVTVQRAG